MHKFAIVKKNNMSGVGTVQVKPTYSGTYGAWGVCEILPAAVFILAVSLAYLRKIVYHKLLVLST